MYDGRRRHGKVRDFFRFKGETIKALIERPSDRAAVVAKLCEGAGGRMDAYYLMFGEWDGFVIADLPDSRAAAATSLAVRTRVTIT